MAQRNRWVHTLCAACVFVLSVPAFASWNGPSQLIHGTAHTLEQGEVMIGVFTPLAYGVNDSLTIVTHPIMTLLLTPNAGFRWRVLDRDLLDVSVSMEGVRSFASEDHDLFRDASEPLGHLAGGVTMTVDIKHRVSLSLMAGYQRDLEPDADLATFGGSVQWLMGPSHLLALQASNRWDLSTHKMGTPNVTLFYAHSWDAFRASVGLAYGKFSILREDSSPLDVPIWPVLDMWWRF